ncbi:conserved exported protein of unknown function [Nitrospira sp. KM1]|uniref:hypothetical protein n=1 Tax=Nitrospira sp. KM1 TaxID=1936990 RepID=UPI0013A7511A|nr:hypothetical protein [Nitrospira sp. KM1]BCA55759.1 conserved exported protein of unknown function [Nitrospira sp. KM1]
MPMNVRMVRSLVSLLVLGIIVMGGLASAQSLTHESQHAHHQKATHGTVLCSWMCATGHVLDAAVVPDLIEQRPVALAEPYTIKTVPSLHSSIVTSRGPPAHTL